MPAAWSSRLTCVPRAWPGLLAVQAAEARRQSWPEQSGPSRPRQSLRSPRLRRARAPPLPPVRRREPHIRPSAPGKHRRRPRLTRPRSPRPRSAAPGAARVLALGAAVTCQPRQGLTVTAAAARTARPVDMDRAVTARKVMPGSYGQEVTAREVTGKAVTARLARPISARPISAGAARDISSRPIRARRLGGAARHSRSCLASL